jgi:hypothetical protein
MDKQQILELINSKDFKVTAAIVVSIVVVVAIGSQYFA